jgi:7,8-dihydropterin-6-yl-methyl-4-(beta-D-ribofuranosyl)aminobenzene 5'-phosphate synthase
MCLPFASWAQLDKPEITLVSVYDNYAVRENLLTDWGFACVIQTPTDTLLFDTGGETAILLDNMKSMDVDPQSIHTVIISHVHRDHRGGLEGFLDVNPQVKVYIPRSFPESVKKMILKKGAKCIDSSGPQQISNGVYTTGERQGPPPEQSLIIDSVRGLVVITGCAHPGIAGIVESARHQLDRDSVHLVLGGFHRPPMKVVKQFRTLRVRNVAPSHCSGDAVRTAFQNEYQDHFIEWGVGKIISITK